MLIDTCVSSCKPRTNKLAYNHDQCILLTRNLGYQGNGRNSYIYLSEATEPAAAGVRLPDHHTLHTPPPNMRGMMELGGSL